MLYSLLLLVVFVQLSSAFFPGINRFAQRPHFTLKSSPEGGGEVLAGDARLSQHQVYMANIPFELEEEELGTILNDKLDQDIIRLKIARDKRTGRSRGFCYIHFNDKESAEAAAISLGDLEIAGRGVRVEVSEQKFSPRTPQENSVFIGNLNYDVTEDLIMEMCNDILGEGNVQKVRLVTDRITGKGRGFGHLDFSSPEEATAAIEKLSGLDFMGRDLKADHAQKRDPSARPPMRSNRENSVFIGNLAWDVNEELATEMLNDVLGPEGGFTTVRIATDRETGRPRGFGHVDFKDKECAERAIQELNGMEVLGRQLRADFAQRRE